MQSASRDNDNPRRLANRHTANAAVGKAPKTTRPPAATLSTAVNDSSQLRPALKKWSWYSITKKSRAPTIPHRNTSTPSARLVSASKPIARPRTIASHVAAMAATSSMAP